MTPVYAENDHCSKVVGYICEEDIIFRQLDTGCNFTIMRTTKGNWIAEQFDPGTVHFLISEKEAVEIMETYGITGYEGYLVGEGRL